MIAATVVLSTLATAPLAAADIGGELHLSSRTVAASVSGVDLEGNLLFDVASDEGFDAEAVPLGDVVAWRGVKEERRRGREAVVLTDGSLIYGTLLTIRGEAVLLQHAAFGPQELRLADVAGIIFDVDAIDVARLLTAWSAESLQAEDTVYTAAGDSVGGVADVDQAGLSLLSRRAAASVRVRRGTEITSLSVSKPAAVRFSPALKPIAQPETGGWWMGFDEGTRLRVKRLAAANDRRPECELVCGVVITLPELALATDLVAIEHPAESPQWKLLGPADLQDARAVAPFTFQPQPHFERSWSVPIATDSLPPNRCRMRAASRLVWEVDGRWTHLTGSARYEPPPRAGPVASDVGGPREEERSSGVAVRLKAFALSAAGAVELWAGPPLDTPGQTLNFTVPLAAGGAWAERVVLLIDSDRRDTPQPSLTFDYLRLSRP